MSCGCCNNPVCLSRPPRNLTLQLQGTSGALLTWLPPLLEDNHEDLEGYDLLVKNTQGNTLYTTSLDADETEYLFENEYFLEDDIAFTVVLEAIYNSCSGSTQVVSVLRACYEKVFTAVHVNVTAYPESTFYISSTREVLRNGQLDYQTGCSGTVFLNLSIPCSEKMKGVLTRNGEHVLTLTYGTTECTRSYEYTPLADGEIIKWEIFLVLDCAYGELVTSDCTFGAYTIQQQITGCMDTTAFNFNPSANVPDSSCTPKIFGCLNRTSKNFNPLANTDDGSCQTFIYGCTDPNSINFNSLANTDDGSCVVKVLGCTDPASTNFNPLANTDDGTCTVKVMGCTDPGSINYNSLANTDDGSCILRILGCMDPTAVNFNLAANADNGTCVYQTPGCKDILAKNFNPYATVDNGSCVYPQCGYGTVVLTEETPAEVIIDNLTEINIFFDNSGSMNATLPSLVQMRDENLWNCLKGFYNNDFDLYNSRVKVIGELVNGSNPNGGWGHERAFGPPAFWFGVLQGPILRRMGSTPEITRVINLVFQDEASHAYHGSVNSLDPETTGPTSAFISDLDGFKTLLSTKPLNYYRAVIFQVVLGINYDGFKNFLEAIQTGAGLYNTYNIADLSSQIKIKYDVPRGVSVTSPTPLNPGGAFYANQVISALNEIGFNLPLC